MRTPESSPPGGGRRKYPLSVKLDAVRQVEAGEQQRLVCATLGVHPSSLLDWLRQYGTSTYAQRKRRVISPALKRQIIAEIGEGRLTAAEAQLKYGLRSAKPLRAWVAAYRAEQRLAPAAPPAPLPPTYPLTAPPAEQLAAVTAQLQQARWQVEALTTLIEQAEATYHIAIRKKAGAKPST